MPSVSPAAWTAARATSAPDVDCGQGHVRPGDRGRERLLAEHVFAGLGGRHDLIGVEAVRGTQADRVDPRILQRVPQFAGGGQALGGGPLAPLRLGIHPENRAEPLAAVQETDDVAAPPAQADHCDVDQRFLQVSGCRSGQQPVSRRA
jgi:hypothetical protein